MDSDGFDLPAGVWGCRWTAFLTLKLESTPLSQFVDPYVQVRHGETTYRQYFEGGAAGQRYLNLSPIFVTGEDNVALRVRLRGFAIRWNRQATLVLFDPPPIVNAKLLVLAPHPDDAEIAAFGIYQSQHSWVATITAGEKGTADLSAAIPPGHNAARWHARLRVWDSLTIPQLGDVPPERCVNLVYPDTLLKDMHDQVGRPFRIACEDCLSRRTLRSRNRAPELQDAGPECTWNGLVGDIRRLLDLAKPRVVLCPHPVIDEHPDHVFTAVALEQAVQGSPHERALFLLYVVHRRDAPIYPFGAAAGVVSLPPWTEHEWLADSMYSHPLASDVRSAKYFAIEAAHNLRVYPDDEPRTAAQSFTAVKREVIALLRGVGLRPKSFLRRAPRPNELFYVVSAGSLSELVKRTLAGSGSRLRAGPV